MHSKCLLFYTYSYTTSLACKANNDNQNKNKNNFNWIILLFYLLLFIENTFRLLFNIQNESPLYALVKWVHCRNIYFYKIKSMLIDFTLIQIKVYYRTTMPWARVKNINKKSEILIGEHVLLIVNELPKLIIGLHLHPYTQFKEIRFDGFGEILLKIMRFDEIRSITVSRCMKMGSLRKEFLVFLEAFLLYDGRNHM